MQADEGRVGDLGPGDYPPGSRRASARRAGASRPGSSASRPAPARPGPPASRRGRRDEARRGPSRPAGPCPLPGRRPASAPGRRTGRAPGRTGRSPGRSRRSPAWFSGLVMMYRGTVRPWRRRQRDDLLGVDLEQAGRGDRPDRERPLRPVEAQAGARAAGHQDDADLARGHRVGADPRGPSQRHPLAVGLRQAGPPRSARPGRAGGAAPPRRAPGRRSAVRAARNRSTRPPPPAAHAGRRPARPTTAGGGPDHAVPGVRPAPLRGTSAIDSMTGPPSTSGVSPALRIPQLNPS